MSGKFLEYLRREHARLDADIQREARRPRPDELLIARLKKMKLVIKERIANLGCDSDNIQAA